MSLIQSSASSSQFTYSKNISLSSLSYFPLPFDLQQPSYMAPTPAVRIPTPCQTPHPSYHLSCSHPCSRRLFTTSVPADLGFKGFNSSFNILASENDSKRRKISKPSEIPAGEIEPPGCSYNPSFESHQDSLAHVVAKEMQKVYKDELGPQPVSLTVPGEVIDKEEMYFLEADDGDDDMEEENLDQHGDVEVEKWASKTKRVTRVELNRRARCNKMLKAEAEAKKLKELSKEIDRVKEKKEVPHVIEIKRLGFTNSKATS
ncbi:Ribosome biogenesis protein Nop53/GLTSCR2 [Dillenia turbinata]|uniref:Ribosome biogenesis protein NOP53 n=1 Tax=Dillenia turbinata TaxID=194707 RepID=A0AAN8V0G4_9MAGN